MLQNAVARLITVSLSEPGSDGTSQAISTR